MKSDIVNEAMADLDPDELDGLDLWDVFDSGSTSTDGEHNEIDIQLCSDDHSAAPCIDIPSALAVENCHRDVFDRLWGVSESEPVAVGNAQDFVNDLWGTSDVVEPSDAVGETKVPSSNRSSCDVDSAQSSRLQPSCSQIVAVTPTPLPVKKQHLKSRKGLFGKGMHGNESERKAQAHHMVACKRKKEKLRDQTPQAASPATEHGLAVTFFKRDGKHDKLQVPVALQIGYGCRFSLRAMSQRYGVARRW